MPKISKVIINYASSESSALEVAEEIKTRAGEKGALGVSEGNLQSLLPRCLLTNCLH